MDRFAPATLLAFTALLAPGGAHALMALRPGEEPPAFSLPDLAGRQVGSDSLAGAPAVVVFWSTWSPRSAEALDDLKRLAGSYAARGLKVVAVNADGEALGPARREAVRAFVAAHELPFPVLLDEGLRTTAAWGVMAQPTEVVLDAGGRLAYVLPGYPPSLREELEGEIRRALGVAPEPPAAAPAAPAPGGMALRHYNLGRRLLAKGDPDRALEAFRRAAAADPGSLDAAVMVARVSLAGGDPGPAERLAREAVPEALERGDLRYLLGGLLLAKGELDGAEATFRALDARLPGEGWGAWGLGQVALARGDAAGALALLRRARGAQADNPEGEAFVRRRFREAWVRRETPPEEEGFVELFPALADLRAGYRRLFAPAGGAP